MARLPQYWAPKQRVQPSERGFNAFETAGRRIGSMYAETARQEMEGAKLAGDIQYNAIEWPYTVSALGSTTSTGSVSSVKNVGSSTRDSTGFSLKPETMPSLSAEDAAASADLGTGASVGSPGGKVYGGTDSGVTVLRGGGGMTPLDRYTQTVGQLIATAPTNPANSTGYWSTREAGGQSSSVTSDTPTYGTGLSAPSGASSSTTLNSDKSTSSEASSAVMPTSDELAVATANVGF